jgi:hypothetical protein
MKYMLMLVRDDEQWEGFSDDERDMEGIGRWFMDLAARGVLRGGEQLHSARSATTVAWPAGSPVVTDGPYLETKETIAGFGIIDVPDLDEALAIARTWPARAHKVEVRPCVEHPQG